MKYVANPVEVDAFKIVSAGEPRTNGQIFTSQDLALEDGRSVEMSAGMIARYVAKAGDYYVVQSDGYVYINPREVFERKYSPVVILGAAIRAAGLQGE